ncbi:MAG: N-acyl homoserine lactonase family protein [Gammaproteobacteria bacterium]
MSLIERIVLALAVATLASSPCRAREPVDLRLYVLDCGYLRTTSTQHWGVTPQEAGITDMAVPCYLIRHGSEFLLFDTGLGDAHAGRADRVGDMTLDVPATIEPQLAAIGIAAQDIDMVAVSHFHFDHVGNLARFPAARLLVQRAEVAQVAARPYPFTPADAVARLNSGKVEALDGDFDVFGDGTVVLQSTPGHSPGHQSLFVRLAREGPVLLSGDLYHYEAELVLNRVPPREAATATPHSRARMQALVEREHGRIWVDHDMKRFRSRREPPAFFD